MERPEEDSWDEHKHPRIGARVEVGEEKGTVAGHRTTADMVHEFIVRLDKGGHVVLDEYRLSQAIATANDTGEETALDASTKSTLVSLLKALCRNALGNLFAQPATMAMDERVAHVYNARIKDPMDFGTMYLKVQHNMYKSLIEVGYDLRRVFGNCRVFNGPNEKLTRMGNSVESLAESLWIEWLGKHLPAVFQPDQDWPNEERLDSCADVSVQELNGIRKRRLAFLLSQCESLLVCDDAQRLLDGLEEVLSAAPSRPLWLPWSRRAPKGIPDVIRRGVASCAAKLREIACLQGASSTSLLDFVSLLCEPFHSVGLAQGSIRQEQGDSQFSFVLQATRSTASVSQLFHEYCLWLDDMLSRSVTPFMEERVLRGLDVSGVWARPANIVWAQPVKNPWWPGIVLAGHRISESLAQSNLSRIPEQILRELLKSRPPPVGMPRTNGAYVKHAASALQDVKAELQNTPLYYIVEFFSTHDFGWVRHDATLPWARSDPNPRGQKKVVPHEAFDEAKDALAYLDDPGAEIHLDWDLPTLSFMKIPLPGSLTNISEIMQNKAPAQTQKGVAESSVRKQSVGMSRKQLKDAMRSFDVADVECDPNSSKRERSLMRVKALLQFLDSCSPLCVEPAKARGGRGVSKRVRDSIGVGAGCSASPRPCPKPSSTDRSENTAILTNLNTSNDAALEYLQAAVPLPSRPTTSERASIVSALFAREAADASTRKALLAQEVERLTVAVTKLEKEYEEEKSRRDARDAKASASIAAISPAWADRPKSRHVATKVGMLSALTKPKHPSARQRNVEESVTPSLQDMLEGSAHSPLDPNMDSADTGDASLEYGEAGDGSVESEPMHKRARIRTSSPVHNEELAKSEKPSKQPRVRRSEFRGVSTSRGRWAAKIDVDGKKVNLGTFDSQEEAANAYDVAAREHFGTQAKTNFDEGGTRIYPKRRNTPAQTRASRGTSRKGKNAAAALDPVYAEPKSKGAPADSSDEDTGSDDNDTTGHASSIAIRAGVSLAASMMPML